MRTLITRGLVHEVGTDPDSGGGLYATTPLFLERLGLTGLAELPGARPAAARDGVDARRAPRQLSRVGAGVSTAEWRRTRSRGGGRLGGDER